MAYTGKFEQRNVRRRRHRRSHTLALSLVLLLTFAIGGTLAYIVANSARVENQFVAGKVGSQVNVSGNKISVTNTDSNVDAYIRAAVVVNWMDQYGNVRGIAPKTGDYEMALNADDTWTGAKPWFFDSASGFYYYKTSVDAKAATDNLITDVTTKVAPPSGYTLSVEVVAEAIQADGVKDGSGEKAVADAWNVSFYNN